MYTATAPNTIYGAFVEDNNATPTNMINNFTTNYDVTKWAAFVSLIDGDNNIARIGGRQGGCSCMAGVKSAD
ncbi:Uncharacterised protein [Raoultella planticola]|uniref:Uncharacterized protein n=1 Tax=Raoultella planticola TaxID=575 RepID=A0A485A8Y5_RAOPL|nr:Uncharacterised protein [Raoultella planticola]